MGAPRGNGLLFVESTLLGKPNSDERALLRAYEDASIAYSQAVYSMRRMRVLATKDEYLALAENCEKLRRACDSAQRALDAWRKRNLASG